MLRLFGLCQNHVTVPCSNKVKAQTAACRGAGSCLRSWLGVTPMTLSEFALLNPSVPQSPLSIFSSKGSELPLLSPTEGPAAWEGTGSTEAPEAFSPHTTSWPLLIRGHRYESQISPKPALWDFPTHSLVCWMAIRTYQP